MHPVIRHLVDYRRTLITGVVFLAVLSLAEPVERTMAWYTLLLFLFLLWFLLFRMEGDHLVLLEKQRKFIQE